MTDGLTRDEEDRLERALAAAAQENHPNPDRIGCPRDKRVLRLLASKKLRPSDPVVQHVAECSPCLREGQEHRRKLHRSRSVAKITACTAALTLVLVVVFWLSRRAGPQNQQMATIDLRPFT